MGYNEDYREGHRRGGWSNQPGAEAFNAGARAGERARDEAQRRIDSPKPPVSVPTRSPVHFPGSTPQPTYAGRGGGEGVGSDRTLADFAKTGAVLCAAVFGGFALSQTPAWNWLQIAVGAALASVAGALGGAALYVALKLLAIAVKTTLILLGIGIALHFLGVLNIFQVLDEAGRLVQQLLAA